MIFILGYQRRCEEDLKTISVAHRRGDELLELFNQLEHKALNLAIPTDCELITYATPQPRKRVRRFCQYLQSSVDQLHLRLLWCENRWVEGK